MTLANLQETHFLRTSKSGNISTTIEEQIGK